MKTRIAFALICVILLALPCATPAQTKKYDVKSGIITFETVIEMGTMKMSNKIMVYFDDYGMKECHDNYNGEKLATSLFSDGQIEYVVKHGEKTAQKRG
jgi:hypothetical protein